jgi:hypothetical protein
MTLHIPPDKLSSPGIESLATNMCLNSIEPMANGVHLLSLFVCSNQWPIGTQQVASLYVTALPGQSSAFVPLLLENVTGTQPDGTVVGNLTAQAGRIVVVGHQPLLEALRSTNGLVQLIFYAQPGTTNEIQATTGLTPTNSWATSETITATNLMRFLQPVPVTNRSLFFRGLRR